MPGFRLLRRLFITFAVLGALFVGANIWLAGFAERQVAKAVASSFELERQPSVDLRGFPLVISVLQGRLDGATIVAEDLTVEDLPVARLEVDVNDVNLVGGILSGSLTSIAVGDGSVMARIEQPAVNRFLKARGEDAKVTLREGSVRLATTQTFLGASRRIVATGPLSLRDGVLRFDPRTVTVDGQRPSEPFLSEAKRRARLRVRLPDLPGRLVPRSVEVIQGAIRLKASLKDSQLDLSG